MNLKEVHANPRGHPRTLVAAVSLQNRRQKPELAEVGAVELLSSEILQATGRMIGPTVVSRKAGDSSACCGLTTGPTCPVTEAPTRKLEF